jgi:hypothetical protein
MHSLSLLTERLEDWEPLPKQEGVNRGQAITYGPPPSPNYDARDVFIQSHTSRGLEEGLGVNDGGTGGLVLCVHTPAHPLRSLSCHPTTHSITIARVDTQHTHLIDVSLFDTQLISHTLKKSQITNTICSLPTLQVTPNQSTICRYSNATTSSSAGGVRKRAPCACGRPPLAAAGDAPHSLGPLSS